MVSRPVHVKDWTRKNVKALFKMVLIPTEVKYITQPKPYEQKIKCSRIKRSN